MDRADEFGPQDEALLAIALGINENRMVRIVLSIPLVDLREIQGPVQGRRFEGRAGECLRLWDGRDRKDLVIFVSFAHSSKVVTERVRCGDSTKSHTKTCPPLYVKNAQWKTPQNGQFAFPRITVMSFCPEALRRLGTVITLGCSIE